MSPGPVDGKSEKHARTVRPRQNDLCDIVAAQVHQLAVPSATPGHSVSVVSLDVGSTEEPLPQISWKACRCSARVSGKGRSSSPVLSPRSLRLRLGSVAVASWVTSLHASPAQLRRHAPAANFCLLSRGNCYVSRASAVPQLHTPQPCYDRRFGHPRSLDMRMQPSRSCKRRKQRNVRQRLQPSLRYCFHAVEFTIRSLSVISESGFSHCETPVSSKLQTV